MDDQDLSALRSPEYDRFYNLGAHCMPTGFAELTSMSLNIMEQLGQTIRFQPVIFSMVTPSRHAARMITHEERHEIGYQQSVLKFPQ